MIEFGREFNLLKVLLKVLIPWLLKLSTLKSQLHSMELLELATEVHRSEFEHVKVRTFE